MKCLICGKQIECGEKVFGGGQGLCCGEVDWSFPVDEEGLFGMIHISCLENPARAFSGPNKAVPEPKEESIVQRSDALELFG